MCDARNDAEENFVPIADIRPGTRRAAVRGVIVELVDDPPQSTTNLREYRYHYRLADASACVELAVPHGILQDLVSRNFNTLSVVPGHNAELAEHVLLSTREPRAAATHAEGPGFTARESDGVTMNFIRGELRNIGADFAEDSEWSGWSEDDNEDSLKWLLQPGDVITASAATAWSHGHLVLVPLAGKKETIMKLGRLDTDFKLDPDLSKQYTSTRE